MGAGRSSLSTQVQQMMDSAFTSQEYGQKLLGAQGLDPSRLSDAAPMDDGIPPLPPTNVYLTSFLGSLNVEWDIPPIDDHVEVGIVEYTPEGGTPQIVEVRGGNGYVIPDLEYVPHSVRVMFKDLWGLTSPWSTAVVGEPAETADYKFDLERARQSGNLTSLIPVINEDLLAGENFAENSVKQVALSTPEHPNQLPLSEVDFDAWPVGQVWPPPDTPANSTTPYIKAEIPSGNTAKVVDRQGIKWLEVVRAAGTISGLVIPFADFKERGVQPGKFYIASVWVQGANGTRVRFGVGGSTDSSGSTRLNMAQTEVVTLDGAEEGKRVYFKFLGDPTYKYIRLTCDTVDPNTTTRWTRFQLEYAGDKTEPSSWTPGVMSTGVMNARMITAIDASIANGIFKTASIDSAAIKNLTADKITAGTINTTEIVVASLLRMATGGIIKAGNTELDSGGLSLSPQSTYNTTAMTRDSKITDTILGRSAIAFYQNNLSNWNGIVLRADGDTGHDGLVAIHATRSGVLDNTTTARIEALSVSSGFGQVRVWQDLVAERHIRALGNLNADGNVVAQGDVLARNNAGNLVSLLSHTHGTTAHDHDSAYVQLAGPTGSRQSISGMGVYVRGSLLANELYINSGGQYYKVRVAADNYLYI